MCIPTCVCKVKLSCPVACMQALVAISKPRYVCYKNICSLKVVDKPLKLIN